MAVEVVLHQGLGVVDDAHGGDGVHPQVGAHQQGLGVGVADAADAGAAVEVRQVLFKFGAEGGVFDGVDLPLEAVLLIVNNHASPAGAQMGVVVHAEENVKGHVALGDRAEESAHERASLFFTLGKETPDGGARSRRVKCGVRASHRGPPPVKIRWCRPVRRRRPNPWSGAQAKNSLDRVMGSIYCPSLYTRMLPEAISSMSITLPSAS